MNGEITNKNSGKQTAVVICPGRGVYNKTELGYLQRYHSDQTDFIDMVDRHRQAGDQLPVSKLDASDAFELSVHTSSENASPLIYTCALADFLTIDREKYDIAAVTGNSMGWYLALACSGVLNLENGLRVVNTMGTIMQKQGEGGQIIYSLVDEQWCFSEEQSAHLDEVLAGARENHDVQIYNSIYLGGMRVLAANDAGIRYLLANLRRVQERYPFQLYNHAAFHSPLLSHVPAIARQQVPATWFVKPELPLIDGRGRIWQPWATDLNKLYEYTLGSQIEKTYDFSSAVTVAIKEFSPDCLILTGPGTTLGAPVAQTLIHHGWQQIHSKDDFMARQSSNPVLLSMAMDEQRAIVLKQ